MACSQRCGIVSRHHQLYPKLFNLDQNTLIQSLVSILLIKGEPLLKCNSQYQSLQQYCCFLLKSYPSVPPDTCQLHCGSATAVDLLGFTGVTVDVLTSTGSAALHICSIQAVAVWSPPAQMRRPSTF